MFPLSVQNNYFILSLCVKGHVKKNTSLNFMSFVGFQASKMCTLFWKIYWRASFEINLGRNNSLKPPVFGFWDILPLVFKNQESWELWLDRFWGNRHSFKNAKTSTDNFFFRFWTTITDLLTALKYWILFFLLSYLEEFQPVKY